MTSIEKENWLVALLVGGGALALAALIACAVHEARSWERFRSAHACRKVGEVTGTVSLGVSANGKGTTIMTPEKEGWLCDDGVTYWR